MLKSVLLLTAALLASTSSFAAQNVVAEAQSLAYELRQQSAYLSAEQQIEIIKHLRAARAIIHADPSQSQDAGEYTCVSRDNDGLQPYLIGVRQGINVTRIQGTIFKSLEECKSGLRSVRVLRATALMCLSRDNDGMHPYQIAAINGTQVTRISRSITKSVGECNELMNSLRFRQGRAVYCTSRDGDGARPYVAASLDINTLQVQVGTESFDSMASCAGFIGQ